MTENISVTFSTLMPDILRHLSVIGKRTATKQGDNVFSSVTLSTAETPIMVQYLQMASQQVVSAIEDFVSNYVETDSGVTFSVTNTRWSAPSAPSFSDAFSKAFKSFLVNYALGEYLDMYSPDGGQKYYKTASGFLSNIVRLVYFKAPPSASSATYEDVTGEVS